MSNSNKSVVANGSKPKSAKAQAKKAANIAAAAERLKRLQERQALEVANKRQYLENLHVERQQQKLAEEKAAIIERNRRLGEEFRMKQAQFQADYINAALNGPHAIDLKRWLMGRQPTFDRLERFFAERPKFKAPQIKKIAA